MSPEPKDPLHFEGYAIERSRWTLQWLEEPIALSRKTFDVLLYLIDHRDRVLGKDELLKALWPGQIVEESNLTQQIFLLRKALSRHESGSRIIETIPGRGYRFIAALDADQAEQSELVINATESVTRVTIEEEEDIGPGPAQLPPARAWRPPAAAILIVSLGLLAAVWLIWYRWVGHSSGPPVQVVLTAMQGGTGDAVLDRSLVDALRIDLAQSPFVSVVSAAAVRATLLEMKLNPDDAPDSQQAREICERTNSQAVLHGNVAHSGGHFLLTEEATSCVNGETLAAATAEAVRAEDLPQSIDKLAASLRQKLGESRRSVARFNAPLFPANTASLEALKAYSEAERMAERQDFSRAVTLMQQAIAADPVFATAYGTLANYYASMGDFVNERATMQKAYELRDSANAPTRLAIIARYNSLAVGDLFEMQRTYQSWADLYPNSVIAWNRLGVVQRELGQHAAATASAARALALKPNNLGLYYNLAISQMHSGDLQAARATCERAIAQGLDGDGIRNIYLKIAYLLGDAELLKAQRDWAAANPNAVYFMLSESYIDVAEGRFGDAHALVAKALDSMRSQGLSSLADSMIKVMGVVSIDAGDSEYGARMLRSAKLDPEVGYELLWLAETGDVAAARDGLRQMQAQRPQDTLWKFVWGPLIGAAIALDAQQPAQAVALLKDSHVLDARNLDLPAHRAKFYLAAGEPLLAEKEFRFILANRPLDPVASAYPLAWLGLGRALALQNNRTGAIDAYQHFLTLWKNADPDAVLLLQGQRELASLQSTTHQ